MLTKKDVLSTSWQHLESGQHEDDSAVIDLEYNVGKDQWFAKVKTEGIDTDGGLGNEIIYEGWNSAFSTGCKNKQLEYLHKIMAFSYSHAVDSKRTSVWCLNLTLTERFLESAQIVRSKHVKEQKAWMSFYTDRTGFKRRKVATTWYNEDPAKAELATEPMEGVVTELTEKFVYGSTMLFISFNHEDPQNFSSEYDKHITIRLKLTSHLPVDFETQQLKKMFSHFIAVTEQGDGHLIHYKNVENVALKTLQFLKSGERLRNTLLHDRNASEGHPPHTVFHASARFLKVFCDREQAFREMFVRQDIFEFLVSCSIFEEIPISSLLVSVFGDNMMRISQQFVDEMIKMIKDNFTKNQTASLHAVHVIKSMVTSAQEYSIL